MGIPSGWRVFQFALSSQAPGMQPLEVTGAHAAYRFEGFDWDEDPLLHNITGSGIGKSRASKTQPQTDDTELSRLHDGDDIHLQLPALFDVAWESSFVGILMFGIVFGLGFCNARSSITSSLKRRSSEWNNPHSFDACDRYERIDRYDRFDRVHRQNFDRPVGRQSHRAVSNF